MPNAIIKLKSQNFNIFKLKKNVITFNDNDKLLSNLIKL